MEKKKRDLPLPENFSLFLKVLGGEKKRTGIFYLGEELNVPPCVAPILIKLEKENKKAGQSCSKGGEKQIAPSDLCPFGAPPSRKKKDPLPFPGRKRAL